MQQSNLLAATEKNRARSRRLRRAIKVRSTFAMAGSRSAQSLETMSVSGASGKLSCKAVTAGLLQSKSPIRLGFGGRIVEPAYRRDRSGCSDQSIRARLDP